MVFLFGSLDWGMTMFAEHTISLRTGEAARYKAVRGSPETAAVDTQKLKNIILYGQPDCAGCTAFLGLTGDDIDVQDVAIPDEGAGTGAVESRHHLQVTVSNIAIQQFTPFFGQLISSRPIVAVHVVEPDL